MSAVKHTPGPWTADPAGTIRAEFEHGLPYVVAVAIAPAEMGRAGFAVQEANARLIAAAPELLEACAAMIEWDAREQDHAVDFHARMALCADAFAKARAAVAKATGSAT